MTWAAWIALTAGLGTMRVAIDRGDVEEAARQGMIAGPSTIAKALAAPDRPARLAGIAAAPISADREGLLEPLAKLAADPDRRTAIPAAIAARQIARELAKRTDPPDDISTDDIVTWRTAWVALALDRDRWIELRVLALDIAAALQRGPGVGIPLDHALADPDPAFRRAAIAVVPAPVPPLMRAPLAATVIKDIDAGVALAAAAALCGDLAIDSPQPVLDALGTAGIERIRSLVARDSNRDAKRCLR
jgi:hypothetical protein